MAKLSQLGVFCKQNALEQKINAVGFNLDMINFYRRYIQNCFPISALTNEHAPNTVVWGDRQENTFVQIKQPILKLPDLGRAFIVLTE